MALETFAKRFIQNQKHDRIKKTGQIEIVYDAFNKILIERTNGEISLAPFPSLETQKKPNLIIQIMKANRLFIN